MKTLLKVSCENINLYKDVVSEELANEMLEKHKWNYTNLKDKG